MKQTDTACFKWFALLMLPLLYFIPPFHGYINFLIKLLLSADLGKIRHFILSFGVWAPIISILLMMFQAIIAPLPALVLVLANAWAFGWLWGAVYSWLGGIFGATLCFYIARWYGRPAVERIFGTAKVAKVDNFFLKYGKFAVLVARLTPILSFDLISYSAGLTAIGLGSFLWATALGQLPAVILYSLLGNNLSKGAFHLLWAIPIVILLVLLGIGVKQWFKRHKHLQQQDS